MSRPASIQVKMLKELQAKMLRVETCLEPKDVNPVLAGALTILENQVVENIHSMLQRGHLPPGWEHIEDAIETAQGKSQKIASAYTKIFRKAAPQGFWAEFGHRIVGHLPNKADKGSRTRAFPFFRNAIASKRAAVRKAIQDGLVYLLARASGEMGIQAALYALSGRKAKRTGTFAGRALRAARKQLRGK